MDKDKLVELITQVLDAKHVPKAFSNRRKEVSRGEIMAFVIQLRNVLQELDDEMSVRELRELRELVLEYIAIG